MNFSMLVVVAFLLLSISVTRSSSLRTSLAQQEVISGGGIDGRDWPTATMPNQGVPPGKKPAGGRVGPTITIPNQGILMGKRQGSVDSYLGIPYAQSPVDERRFAPPVTDPPVSWNGIRDATKFAHSCLQVTDEKQRKRHENLYRRLLSKQWTEPKTSEDCLYLNVYVPSNTQKFKNNKRPVMVWFHGGDFNTGSPAMWDATYLVNAKQILVVTVAYRLNIFGFFTTGDGEAPGNYGMLDQVAALDWIQRNIRVFNGTANNVLIAGHNAGGISVGLHMSSPLSRGKFTKALVMSGDALSAVRTPEQELTVADEVASIFTCNRQPTSEMMTCMRRIPGDLLLQQTAHIETWGPIIDATTNNSTDPFLPMHPRDILDSQDFNAVPLMAGYTSNELSLTYLENLMDKDGDVANTPASFEALIRDEEAESLQNMVSDNSSDCRFHPELVSDAVLLMYRPLPINPGSRFAYRQAYLALQTEKHFAAGIILLADKVAARHQHTYVYRFDYRLRARPVADEIPDWAGVPHMMELPFVWGLPFNDAAVDWRPEDRTTADLMIDVITLFLIADNVVWSPYTLKTPGILIIDSSPTLSTAKDIDYRALEFWKHYYSELRNEAIHCCNKTNAYSAANEKSINLSFASILFFVVVVVVQSLMNF